MRADTTNLRGIYYGPSVAARILGITTEQVITLVEAGKLQSVRSPDVPRGVLVTSVSVADLSALPRLVSARRFEQLMRARNKLGASVVGPAVPEAGRSTER